MTFHKSLIKVTCEICGETYSKNKYHKTVDNRNWCRKCIMGEHNKPGDEHPSWKGGSDRWVEGRWHYDKNGYHWKTQRRKCWTRDMYKCRLCGKGGLNDKPDCHHIIPYEISRSHTLNNLMSLCKNCHMKIDNYIRNTGRYLLLGEFFWLENKIEELEEVPF